MSDRNEQTIREIVKCTMAAHPKECVFRPDAEDFIVRFTLWHSDGSKESILDACEKAFREAEIYCPAHDE